MWIRSNTVYKIFSFIDDQMGSSYPSECIEKFIHLARPSMAQEVRELKSMQLMLPESNTIVIDSSVTHSSKHKKKTVNYLQILSHIQPDMKQIQTRDHAAPG